MLKEVRECFTVYRPLSRSSQSLPVIITMQIYAKNSLNENYANFKSSKDAFNRAAEKYGFARILFSSRRKEAEAPYWSGGKLTRRYIYRQV